MAQNRGKTIPRGPGRKFQPGVSGNPGGRPVSRPYKEALEKALANGDLEKVTRALVEQAKKGNVHAIREIAERLDGKVDQSHKLLGGEEPIKYVHHLVGFGDDA